jgi:hypothetical protein
MMPAKTRMLVSVGLNGDIAKTRDQTQSIVLTVPISLVLGSRLIRGELSHQPR